MDISEELEREGRINGQVRLYNTEKDERIESDPNRFLERTLTTDGLRRSLRVLRDSLSGEDPRGTHLLRGPFGTGKSHQMLVLYHCLNSPRVARSRFGGEIPDLAAALPDESLAIPVSLHFSQPEYLWEPFFDALDYDAGSYDTGGFPAIADIMDAVGDREVALFVDELERWFNTLDEQEQEKTEGFLQALLEASSELDNLHVFVSILQDNSEIHGILNRENAVSINMREEVDVRDLIHHRLFTNGSKEDSRELIGEIVDRYLDAYNSSDYVSVPDGYREEMIDAYPFHPALLDTLEETYYARDENQATRWMLYLLSKVVLSMREETDLIVHGDLEPRETENRNIGAELSDLDDDVHAACVDDIERVTEAGIEYGSRILNTLLLYSLRPGQIEIIGANRSDIVVGTYHTGDGIADVVRDINRIDNGNTWHVHKKGDRYAIKASRTVSALISDKKVEVDREDVHRKIRSAIQSVFDGGNAVVNDGDLTEVPDNKRTKVVIKAEEWEADEVETVIKSGDPGREYRNTLVFVEPEESVLSKTTVEKARELAAAELVKLDDTIDQELRNDASERAERERRELRERIEVKYGRVLDGDNLLLNFEGAVPTDFSVFGVGTDAEDIADSQVADQFNIRTELPRVASKYLDRKGEATVIDLYNQFLQAPGLPLPESADAVMEVIDELADESVLVHSDGEGFRDRFDVRSKSDTLVDQSEVETWSTEDIEEELVQRLKQSSLDFDEFVAELRRRTNVRLNGDPVTAAVQLQNKGECEFVSGRETKDSPRGATIRTDVRVVGVEELQDQLGAAVIENGRATVSEVLSEFSDTTVFQNIEATVREAVTNLLDGEYLVGDRYTDELPTGVNPMTVTLVPTVTARQGAEIEAAIRELNPGETFSLRDVAPDMAEEPARSFLLQNLGSAEPEYLLENGSSDPRDWDVGMRFEVPGTVVEFREFVDSKAGLLDAWADMTVDGEVTEGELSFDVPGVHVVGEFTEVAEVRDATTRTTLDVESGQPMTHVTRLFNELPEEATNIDAKFEFQR